MNWTGGELMRAAPTKAKTLRRKHKAQFARARANAAHVTQATRPDTRSLTTTRPVSIVNLTGVRSTDHGTLSTSGMDREEYRLLMKRQEMLRRPDWLDLQATKPMEISFASRSDKLLIGRRRKMKKTTTRPPLPQHQALVGLPTRGFATRQASIHEDTSVRIKIGTNALDSQTQHSSLHRPVQQRKSPADLDSLSEEPMLLDSDDDLFERVTPRQIPIYVADQSYDRPVEDRTQHQYNTACSADTTLTDNSLARRGGLLAKTHSGDSEQALPWSTSKIDDPPVHIALAGQPSMRENVRSGDEKDGEANDECQHTWKGFCGISTSSYHNASFKVQPTQKQSSSNSHPVLVQPILQDLRSPATESHDHKAQQDLNAVRLQHAFLQARTAMPLQETAPIQTTSCQTQEELWRRFILGDNGSDSEESLPIASRGRSNLMNISSPKHLKPLSIFDTDSTHGSHMATRGARTHAIPSSRLMAGANSSLDGLPSSQPSVFGTTAAVASSTWRV
ncbi:hypothetical protein AMS68_000980 [Peltaster fructicola]|uniref:Uncharacterized protein n=1 Tax=Peltaster fructicola TaxID=286661 RepID=A0A6H0XL69_9PEZI|nr:hypothetical protein AMS68_000980 [Peltaster fructicola]